MLYKQIVEQAKKDCREIWHNGEFYGYAIGAPMAQRYDLYTKVTEEVKDRLDEVRQRKAQKLLDKGRSFIINEKDRIFPYKKLQLV